MGNERRFAPKELAAEIGIPESTLRRWCKVLEDAGHVFEREQQKRLFTQRDADLMQAVQKQMTTPGATLDEACRVAIQTNATSPAKSINRGKDADGATRRFEELLNGLAERIYWSGADMAVQELQTAYAESKKERSDR